MTEPTTTATATAGQEPKRIVAGEGAGLPELLQSLRSTQGDRAVVVIRPESGVFLTASEFRALKTTAEAVGVTVSIETDDRLRRQLASMFSVDWAPLPAEAPVARAPRAWPARREVVRPGEAEVRPRPDAARNGGMPEAAVPPEAGAPVAEVAAAGDEGLPADDPLALPTSKPWRAEVIDASRETALPPPPSMVPEVVDDLVGTPTLEPRRRRGAGRRVAVVAGVLLAVLAVGALGSVWLRTATVRVTLARQPVTSEVRFGVRGEGVEAVEGAAFMVDGREVSFEETFSTSVPVTGTITEQTKAATGEVDLSNTSGEAVTIPAGTELATREGIRYRTTEEVELERGTAERPAFGSVAIESVTGGDAANVEAGKLVAELEGFEGVYYANRRAAVEGGEGRDAPGVSVEDTEGLVTLARAELDKQAGARTIDGARVVPSTLAPEGGISYELDHEVGDAAEALGIRATLTYTATAVDPAAVSAQADAALREGLAAGTPAGFELDPASVQIGAADGVPDGADGLMRVTATAEARATLDDAERDALAEAMADRSPVDARQAALANPDVADVRVEVSPTWLTDDLPGAGRIDVTAE